MTEKKRSPIIAALFSLVDPGLAYVYNGNLNRGIAISAIFLCVGFAIFVAGLLKYFVALVLPVGYILGRFYFVVKSAVDAKRVSTIPHQKFNRWYIYILYTLLSLILSFLINSIDQTKSFKVPTSAMEPSILADELVVADMTCYRSEKVKPGDVIVFRAPADSAVSYVKRCVALGGHTVQIRDGILFVDSERFMPSLVLKRASPDMKSADFKDPAIYPPGAGNIDQYGPVIVPTGKIFTLGDFRDNSYDSRYIGFVREPDVIGKVLYIYWSKDFGRIGKKVE